MSLVKYFNLRTLKHTYLTTLTFQINYEIVHKLKCTSKYFFVNTNLSWRAILSKGTNKWLLPLRQNSSCSSLQCKMHLFTYDLFRQVCLGSVCECCVFVFRLSPRFFPWKIWLFLVMKWRAKILRVIFTELCLYFRSKLLRNWCCWREVFYRTQMLNCFLSTFT